MAYIRTPGASAQSATSRNIVGGRDIVAADQVPGSNTSLRNNTMVAAQSRHLIVSDCSDIRLVYTARSGGSGSVAGVLPETDLANIVYIQAGVALSSSATSWYPVTFGGRRVGELAPGVATLISDTIPLDLTAGTYLYERTHQFQAFGAATTLSASTSANATSFTIAAMPNITSGNFTVDTGVNLEVVEVVTVTGTGPYTCTINPNVSTGATRAKLALAHSSGVAVYQTLYTDRYVYADRGEFKDASTSSPPSYSTRVYSGTLSTPTAIATTLSAAANIGDTTIQLAASVSSPTLTIAATETVTVVNVTGTSAPFTYWLAAPLANAQSSGAAVTSGTGYTSVAFGAKCIVADYVSPSTRKPPIVVVGDSVSAGTGYYLRGLTSYLDIAFAGTNPVINLGIGGDKATTFLTLDNSIGRRKWLGVGGWLIIEYGINDLTAGRTLAQLQADITAIMALGRSRGMKVAITTQTPRPGSSTDGWMTVANQTLDPYESVRLAYNAWLRGGTSGADRIIDVNAVLDSGLVAGGAATGKWLAGTSNGPYTVDGTHPSTLGHQLMATAINPALFT